jgi:hypothetical protein
MAQALVILSAKQKARVDRWERKYTVKLVEVEEVGDVTAEEEESDCYYDSDHSY